MFVHHKKVEFLGFLRAELLKFNTVFSNSHCLVTADSWQFPGISEASAQGITAGTTGESPRTPSHYYKTSVYPHTLHHTRHHAIATSFWQLQPAALLLTPTRSLPRLSTATAKSCQPLRLLRPKHAGGYMHGHQPR